jgi:hypothetical protein
MFLIEIEILTLVSQAWLQKGYPSYSGPGCMPYRARQSQTDKAI